MRCEDIGPELLEPSTEVERHLADCGSCRKKAAELGALGARLEREGRADRPPRDLRRRLWRPKRRRWIVAAAAALLFVMLLLRREAPPAKVLSGSAKVERERVTTAAGTEAIVRLFDGSTVALRPETRLAARADGERRLVHLEHGGAHFDVVRGGVFEIRTPVATLQVLGTRFDMALDGNALRVTVFEGSVRVTNEKGTATLTPGEALQVERGQALPAPERVDLAGDSLPPGAVARLGSARLRHGGRLSSMAASPDGKLLATSCTSDGWVRLWDPASGRLLHSLEMPATVVTSVAFSRDGKLLAASCEKAARIWDLSTKKPLETFEVEKELVWIAISPDGATLAAASEDETVHLWDLKSRREREPLRGHKGQVDCVAYSPKGDLLASSEYQGPLHVWSTSTGKEAYTIGATPGFRLPCAFSPDGRMIARGGDVVKLYDAADGKSLGELSPLTDVPDRGASDSVEALAFSPDGRHLALKSQKGISLWDLAGRKRLFLFMLPESSGPWSSNEGAVAFTADGRRFGANTEGVVRFWEVPSGRPVPAAEGPEGGVSAIALAPDGATAATASKDGTIRLWQTATGKPLAVLKEHTGATTSVAFSPDGKLLASGDDHETVKLWDLAARKPLRSWTGREGNVGDLEILDLRFAPDGQKVSYLSGQSHLGGFLHVNDARTGASVWTQRRGGDQEAPLCFIQHPSEPLLIYGERSGALSVWSRTNEELRSIEAHKDKLRCLALSPDGRFIVSGGQDGTVMLWTLDSWKQEGLLRGEKPVGAVAVSPDGRRVASGGDDGVVRLWEVATGLELAAWSGHLGEVTGLAFTGDGKLLLSSSADATALVWGLDGASAAASPSLDASWSALEGRDGPAAFRAIGDLVRGGAASLSYLKGRLLRPLPGPSEPVKRLIADLDRDEAALREKASQELRGLGEEIEGQLLGALQAAPSPEVRTRLKALLELSESSLVAQAPEARRLLRSIEVLERLGARSLLEELSAGAPFIKARRAAAESLKRLAGR